MAGAPRSALASDDPSSRKSYLRLFVDQVIVGDGEIRLRGPTAALAKATATGSLPLAASVVPGFGWQWRAGVDDDEHYVCALAL